MSLSLLLNFHFNRTHLQTILQSIVASTNDSLIITVIEEPTAQYFNTYFTILSCGCKNRSCGVCSPHHPSKHNVIEYGVPQCLSVFRGQVYSSVSSILVKIEGDTFLIDLALSLK